MEFCPKCEMRLALRKSGDELGGLILVCPKCGYSKEAIPQQPIAPPATGTPNIQEQIAVIGEQEAKIRTMPTMKAECPKCQNSEAYWWMVQTRGADESPTQFFRCTNCGYTWREMA